MPPDPPGVAQSWRAVPLLVALVAVAAYAATLGYDFVWDDTLLIQQSWRLHYWRELPALLTSHFWAEAGEASQYYRPLVTLTFFLDMRVWGLHPFGFHGTNVLIHVAVSLAVLAVARRAMAGEVAATACALAFTVHPLHTESVSFVSGRTDIVATLFFLLALLAYDRGRDRKGWGLTAWSLMSYLLALLAKEVAITLPAVLMVWDSLARGDLRSWRSLRNAGARYAVYGGVAGLYLGLRAFALGGVLESSAETWGPFPVRALTTVKIMASYAWITVAPYPTKPYYMVLPETVPPGLAWWLAAAGLAVALGGTVWAARRAPIAGLGALWFWITLGPSVAMNLLPLSSTIMAERFLYLPTVGFGLLLGWAAARLLGLVALEPVARIRPAPSIALAAVLLAFGVLTLWRNEDWRDDYRLFSRMVETSPGAAIPHVNLAFAQLPRGEIGPANQHLREAVRLAPGNAKAHAGLGLTEALLGNREAGLRHGLQARALAPTNADVLASLGALYLHLGEPACALPELTEALRIRPNQAHAALNRALALAWLGHQDAAEAQLERALALVRLMSPDLPLADRITAEVAAGRDPVRAEAAWERYLARLRAASQLNPSLVEELGRAKEQLRERVVAPPERRLGECEDHHRGGRGDNQVEQDPVPWTAAQPTRFR